MQYKRLPLTLSLRNFRAFIIIYYYSVHDLGFCFIAENRIKIKKTINRIKPLNNIRVIQKKE